MNALFFVGYYPILFLQEIDNILRDEFMGNQYIFTFDNGFKSYFGF